MSDKLSGKIALITGGNSGIGLATAKRFVDEGARHVFITGRRQKELDQAVGLIGRNITGVQGDVSSLADLNRLYTVISEQQGRLDILFANAGLGEFAPLGAITEEHFDKIFGLNVKAMLFTVQNALPLLSEGASIILNASVSASKGFEAFSVYCASKAAVRSFARCWAVDLKARRIRVNAISPGLIDTPGARGLTSTPEEWEQFRTALIAIAPLGRAGDPDETAKAVVFLASDDSSYITGTELFIDGGMAQI